MRSSTKWCVIDALDENNDADGQVTLAVVLANVRAGRCPDPRGAVNMGLVEEDLRRLIRRHGGRKPAEHLLLEADWEAHAFGRLQAQARTE